MSYKVIPIDEKKLSLLCREGNKAIYEYTPNPFSLLYHDFEKMTFPRRIRLLMEYFAKGSYKVYYLSVDGNLVGHCVVAYGNRRLKRSSENDIVLGPYFVDPQFRGKGYAKDIIRLTLANTTMSYRYAYDYINKSNIPSAKATLACGFEKCGELDIEGFLHKLVEREGGEYDIFRYTPDK